MYQLSGALSDIRADHVKLSGILAEVADFCQPKSFFEGASLWTYLNRTAKKIWLHGHAHSSAAEKGSNAGRFWSTQ